jgi:hypothetical protein
VSRTAQEDRDLYVLIGRYETFSENVLKELREINIRLEAGDLKFHAFEQRSTAHDTQLSDHEKRLKTIEKTGVPKRTKQQLDGTTILTFVNTILTVLSRLWPF